MQIATLNYRSNPKDNLHNDSKSKFQHRHILTTIKNSQKKPKQQRSFLSDISTQTNLPLPPIKTTNKQPDSIRIKGNGLTSSKFNDVSLSSFRQPSRSRSRQSDKSDILATRSRSITPTGGARSKSRSVHLRFGYPVKIRSADFYAPNLTESELRVREDSFVNDSIRTAAQSIRPFKVPHYEPLDDPHLKSFFQSPSVLNVLRKTLNIEVDERPSQSKRRSRPKNRDQDYHRVVAKHSSGYGKLNGYDCIPPFAPPRQNRSKTLDQHQSSANTSFTSFPTYHSFPYQQKKKSHSNNKFKKLAPIARSSPVRQKTAATNDTITTNDTVTISIVSQD